MIYLKLQKTNHSYYCSESNYYVGRNENFGRSEYATWKDLKDDWLINDDLDDDYNHLFRFDIFESKDDDGNPTEKFELFLFFILQRKGIYRPVWIKEITEEDMPEIKRFLEKRWEYMKNQWIEFSK